MVVTHIYKDYFDTYKKKIHCAYSPNFQFKETQNSVGPTLKSRKLKLNQKSFLNKKFEKKGRKFLYRKVLQSFFFIVELIMQFFPYFLTKFPKREFSLNGI